MTSEHPYIPSKSSLEFIAFIRACGVEEHSNPEIHYRLADKYFSKDKQVLIEAFRGSAKSSLMEWFIIYAAVKGEVPGFGEVGFIMFIGDSMENGVKNAFRNILGKIDQSPLIQSLITVKRKTDNEMELVNVDGHELNIKGYGAGTNIRGTRYKNRRPDIAILDDITTNEAITSETIQNTINANFYKSVIPALHPTRFKIFYIGTPISERDLLHQLSNNSNWVVHKFPVCKEFPCTREEFVGYWEDRFPYEAVKEKYDSLKESGKAQDFYQEYMLEITDLTTLLVEEDDIQWYDPSIIKNNKDGYNFYISTDFATSTKKSADFSTIGVWAISSNNDWLLVDGQCMRQTMQENIDDLFRYVKKWKPLSVGIENSGQQGGFISIMQEMMMKRNTWFTFAKKPGSKDLGIRPIKDKVHRFVTGVQPKFKQNKIWLPKPELAKLVSPRLFALVEELVSELSKFTLAGGVKSLLHDDCVTGDTLVTMADGSVKRIDIVEVGEEVVSYDIDLLTQPVEEVKITGVKEVYTYVFSDGTELSMTDNHPVLTTRGYIPAELLTTSDEVISWNKSNTMDINGQKRSRVTTSPPEYTKMVNVNGYTNMYGQNTMDNNLKGTMYITLMVIKRIIIYLTLNYWKQVSIQHIRVSREIWLNKKNIWNEFVHWLQNGINRKRVENGQETILKTIEKRCLNIMIKNVDGAKNPLKLDSVTGLPIATVNANFKQYRQTLLDRKNSLASGVEVPLSGIEERLPVVKNVSLISLLEKKDRRLSPTYNLEVKRTHNFLANGIVVHNCIDLLNQLSEMDIFTPSDTSDGYTTTVTEDGLIWESIFEEDENGYKNSTIF